MAILVYSYCPMTLPRVMLWIKNRIGNLIKKLLKTIPKPTLRKKISIFLLDNLMDIVEFGQFLGKYVAPGFQSSMSSLGDTCLRQSEQLTRV
jgi:hypothetical protein